MYKDSTPAIAKASIIDNAQPRVENRRFTGGNQFNAGTNIQNMPRVTNDNKPVRENVTNRMQTRAEPATSPQTKPAALPDNPSNRGTARFDNDGKGHKDVGTWQREVPVGRQRFKVV